MSITNGPTSLSALFNDQILVVPNFQRAYAWKTEHLRSYIDDLKSQPKGEDQRYFFGTILLATASGEAPSRYQKYAIVDGQQRLTTTCLFVSASTRLLYKTEYSELAEDNFGRYLQARNVRKFHTIEEDDAFLERLLIKGDTTESDCDTPSQKRILEAHQFFSEVLAVMPIPEIASLLDTIWNAQILIYAVRSNAEATQIFELQNDRGKRLTNLEALKSFLMHGVYLSSKDTPDTDLKIVQSQFASIYRNLEKIEPLFDAPGEDQLLSYHCIAYETHVTLPDKSEGWRRPKDLVKALLHRQPVNARLGWIKDFSFRLSRSYANALQIISARDSNSCIPLGDLAVLGRTASFWPLLLKSWPADSTPNKKEFRAVTALMARFAFQSSIANKRSDTGESTLRGLAVTFQGDFASLTKSIAAMTNQWEIPKYLKVGLDSEDFYGWGGLATYLLWKYENHLRSQPGRQTARLEWGTVADPKSFAVRYAKDHIQAKNPAIPELKRLVKWDSQDSEFRPFSEVFLHRLGNLVLDTISTGAAKGSDEFKDRIEHYTSNAQFLSQGEIVSKFARKNEEGQLIWDEETIKARHLVLVEFALSI